MSAASAVVQAPDRDIGELHWMLTVLENVEVGMVVLDRDYRIHLWNGFMQDHSGLSPSEAHGHSIFELFCEIQEDWFRRKAESVFLLRSSAFTVWEQRPYVFRFHNYRPVTGTSEHMYQNMTMMPLVDTSCEVSHICIIIYDVTDAAVSRIALGTANRELERISRVDGLTGLFNRAHWEERLADEFQRFERSDVVSSLVMLDIDHFKAVNDTHGHQAGDEVIRALAAVIERTARGTDIQGRYGGEEFAVVLVDTDGPSAMYFAERLRKAAAATVVEQAGEQIRFTVSLGVCESDATLDGYGQWIERADQCLYASKTAGRD